MTSLIWLNNTWEQLTRYKTTHTLPSALLFTSPEGAGKHRIAREFAHYVLCQQNGQIACNHCRGCLLFNAGTHPDFFSIQPEEGSRIIKIEQIRALTESLVQTSQFNGVQVVILSLAEALNKAAGNALLKTLEEPRGQVLLILLSHQLSSVLPTILSRCQIIKLPLPGRQVALTWLASQLGSSEKAATYLDLADNLPFKALHYAEENKQDQCTLLIDLLLAIRNGKLDPLEAAEQCLQSVEESLLFLQIIILDMIRLKLSSSTLLTYADKQFCLSSLNQQLSVQQLFSFLANLLDARKLIKQHNINLQLTMEKIFITWCYLHDFS